MANAFVIRGLLYTLLIITEPHDDSRPTVVSYKLSREIHVRGGRTQKIV